MMCPHFGVCGGCSKQDRSYEKQLQEKETQVRNQLAGLDIGVFHSIMPSAETMFYRNKMEYSFGDLRDVEILKLPRRPKIRTSVAASAIAQVEREHLVHLGLHPKGRFALVTPTPECTLLSEEAQRIMEITGAWATEHNVSTYVRKNATGDLRHLVIREGKNSKERMVNLVARSTTPHVDLLASRLKELGSAITTFMWTRHDGLSDVAMGGDGRTIFWGEGSIRETIGLVEFRVRPETFMQTNTRAAERMIELLKQWMGDGRGTLLDLYCGSGAIGLNVAKSAEKVIGVEINALSIEEARQTAERNGITNAEFHLGKAEDITPALFAPDRDRPTWVVVDPPRAGLHASLRELLLQTEIPNLFYVSCNPESLSRDLRVLSSRYRILDVQPMDFFPHTDHVETAVRLTRIQ